MNWHVDHTVLNRVFAYFIALNEPGGGDLCWNQDGFPIDGAKPDEDFRRQWQAVPTTNRLILMPAWYPHRSLPCDTERHLLHGHLNT